MGLLDTLKAAGGAALMAGSCMGVAPLAQAATAAAVPRYTIKALGVPPSVESLFPSDLNDLGEVTGWARKEGSVSPFGVGFVYRDGLTTLLEPSPPDVDTPGLAINNRGEVAGFIRGPVLESPRPVIYRNGSVVDLRPEPVDRYAGMARDINNAGVTTGQIGGQSFIHDGTQARFLDIAGEASHTGLAISDAGEVLIQGGRPGEPRFYLYRESRATQLPQFGPDPSWRTYYHAMNNAGQVLGAVESCCESGPEFIYNYMDGSVHFIDVPDQSAFAAYDINDSGWIVGDWFAGKGFLYRNGQLQAFGDLLPPDVRDQWRDVRLAGMNNTGQILGTGVFAGPDGSAFRTFVATPVPEPGAAALTLAGLGVVGWAARARRNCSTQN